MIASNKQRQEQQFGEQNLEDPWALHEPLAYPS
jgi:hypothetical protein